MSSSNDLPETTIPFGPDHRARLEAFIGCPLGWPPRYIDQSVYLTPHWKAIELADGRVLLIVERTWDSHVRVLPDYCAFAAWRNAWHAGDRDPETGRLMAQQ